MVKAYVYLLVYRHEIYLKLGPKLFIYFWSFHLLHARLLLECIKLFLYEKLTQNITLDVFSPSLPHRRGPCKGDYNDKHRKIGKVSDNDANDSRLSLGRGQAQVAFTLLSKIYICYFLLHNINLILINQIHE